jgi:hypothetical protein
VLLIVAAVIVGVVIGLLLGGSLASLAELHLRWWWLALIGLGLQLVPSASAPAGQVNWLASALLALSYLLLFIFLAINIRVAGVPLLALGIALNALAIGVNGGMPVSDAALRSAYSTPQKYEDTRIQLLEQGAPKHHLADADTRLRPITDIIGVGPPVAVVYSVGDLVAMAGIVWLLAAATRGGPGRHARRSAVTPSEPARPADPE